MTIAMTKVFPPMTSVELDEAITEFAEDRPQVINLRTHGLDNRRAPTKSALLRVLRWCCYSAELSIESFCISLRSKDPHRLVDSISHNSVSEKTNPKLKVVLAESKSIVFVSSYSDSFDKSTSDSLLSDNIKLKDLLSSEIESKSQR